MKINLLLFMWNNLKQNKKGFSLFEILVVMSIFMVITFISSDYIVNSFRATTFNEEQETAVTNARRAVTIIKKEIRGANNSEMGSYPLSIIDDNEFEYYSDIDNDDEMEKIRYFINNLQLIKSVTEPGLNKDYTTTATETVIANYVNNQEEDVFRYYDGNQNETSVINEIRLIKIILKINVTPEKAPNDYYVESSVNLRNLKDNL